MDEKLRVLILEDVSSDAELIERELQRERLEFSALRVETKDKFLQALDSFRPDLVVSDYILPGYDGLTALEAVKAAAPGVPFIFVTGAMGEEWAIDTLKSGATDFVLKSRLARLGPVVRRALHEASGRAELIQAEERIRAQNEFLNTVLASLAHPFYIVNVQDHRVVMANPACRFPAMSAGTATCYALTHRRGTPCEVCPLPEVVSRKEPVTAEHVHYDSGGGTSSCEIHAYPIIDRRGAVEQVIIDSLDISERKKAVQNLIQSEQRYRDLFDNANDIIQLIDKSGAFLYVNKQCLETLEFRAEEMAGMTLWDIIREDQRAQFHRFYRRIGRGESIARAETVFLSKNGREIQVEGNVNAQFKDGRFVSARAIFRDISERKRVEDDLRKAVEELKSAQQDLIQSEKLAALGRWSLGIAHEIRNPLGVILGGIEFLDRKIRGGGSSPDPDVETTVRKIKDSVFRANVIIQNLLQFSRPSTMNFETIAPAELINEALSLLRFRIPMNHVRIRREYAREEILLSVDRRQMQQVLLNILVNAIEAMPQGGEIAVRTHVGEGKTPEEKALVIEIEDGGVGIPRQNFSKIFEPFFTTKGEKGTGLGLSMAKMIVENHKGRLLLESRPRKGTRAKIVLPAGPVADRGRQEPCG